jgi:hypothetical protein
MVNNNYKNTMDNYYWNVNRKDKARSDMMGGLFGIATAAAGNAGKAAAFSDRRLKRNIERVGTMASGLPLYEYEYIWGGPRQVGVMGDEVLAVRPDAVSVIDGFLAVDYAALGD